jgi:hypothetical protein
MMSKTTTAAKSKSRSGPRSPPGTRPLTVNVNEQVIEDAKIEAIRQKTNVSQVTGKLLRGWLAGKFNIDE